jgi:hypothetical protein
VFQGKGAAGRTIRQKSFNPQNDRTYDQVATPFYLKSEALMMIPIFTGQLPWPGDLHGTGGSFRGGVEKTHSLKFFNFKPQ